VAFFIALIIGGGPHKRILISSAGLGSHFCEVPINTNSNSSSPDHPGGEKGEEEELK
jgi:hypothetical protein